MKHGVWIGIVLAMLMAACSSFPSASGRLATTDPTLASIDSLLWTQPDSAFVQLQAFAESHEVDSLNTFNRHYFHLLLSELLYKNDYAQTNRNELLHAVSYYDSLVVVDGNRVHPDLVFLDARSHYIDGVGYYEMDSVVPACGQYLKAAEVMENRFGEEELVGKKAQLMAMTYTHLCGLFSKQYLHEESIYFGKRSLKYFKNYDFKSWHIAWMLDEIGSQYNIISQLDSADYYYKTALEVLADTNSLTYRDISAVQAILYYRMDNDFSISIKQLSDLLARSESEAEYMARCAVIGELYYYEHLYDSALVYLETVYQGNSSTPLKKQVAEWLVEISKAQGEGPGPYAEYLMQFANQEEKNSVAKAELSTLCNEYGKRRQENKEQETKQSFKRGLHAVVLVMFVLLVPVVFYVLANRRKCKLLQTRIELGEEQLAYEKQAHRIKQLALGGRLKKNMDLKKLKATVLISPTTNPKQGNVDNYADEAICKHILEVCNDPNNPIKATLPSSSYANIALNEIQKTKLKEAAFSHYGKLFLRITHDYPKLNDKDLVYCQLCLLGLNNIQIAVLLQKAHSTISEREKRIQKIFGTDNRVSVILQELLMY